MNTYDNLVEKWSPVLNEETAGSITDSHKRSVTAALLENTEKALLEERQLTEAAPTNSTG